MRIPSTYQVINTAEHYAQICVGTASREDNLLGTGVKDELVLYVEACLAFLYQMRNATSKRCLIVASCSFYHAMTGKSVIGSFIRVIEELVSELHDDLPFFQSSNSNWIDVCDGLYKNVQRVKNSTLGNKIIKVFNHIVAHAFYTKAGIEVDPKLFRALEEKRIRPKVWDVVSFADAIVGLLLFLAKAGRQALLTGSIESFFIDETVVTTWLDEAATIRKDAEFISSPSVIGTTLPAFIGKLADCIATGENLSKAFRAGVQHNIIHSVLLELKMVHKRHNASLLAAKFRRAPIGVFLYGTAGVAKSFISVGLFNHYCSVRGIEAHNATCWTRDDNDPFYSGYKSHFAGVLYDDAAKFRSSVVQGVDPSIADIISAINNIPFITNQAELQDKGKIPFLSEWVGVTSNLGDLNADKYYNSSAAFLRRLKVRIEPIVKDEFRVPGEDRIDTTKIPLNEQYPDLWEFKVCEPVVNGMHGEYREVAHYKHYSDLLRHMTHVYKRHIAEQDKLMETTSNIGPEVLCDCQLPKSICQCVTTTNILANGAVEQQAGVHVDPALYMDRVHAASECRSELYLKYAHLKGADAMMFKDLWSQQGITDIFNPTVVHHQTADTVATALREHIDGGMRQFMSLNPRQKLAELTEGAFHRQDNEDDYLSFVPRCGKPCFFMQEQLSNIKQQVLMFTSESLTDVELALLDNYVYEHAPRHVGNGWPISDIIKGGLDYVKFYAKATTNPDMLITRSYLLGPKEQVVWHQKLGIWFATQYFERVWFYNTCNYIASFSVVRAMVPKAIGVIKGPAMANVARRAAKAYDLTLGGDNTYVVLFVKLSVVASIVAVIFRFISSHLMPKDISVTHIHYSDGCDTSVFFDGDCATAQRVIDTQMDLTSIGKKPVVRETEAKNVWTVKERSITKFDVDPRRPQNVDQCEYAIRHNLKYAQIRGFNGENNIIAKTRILLIDNDTLVVNNHAMLDTCKLEIWYGPKTEDGPQPSVVIDIMPNMLERHPTRDICFVRSWSLPYLVKNICHLFPKRSFQSVGPSWYFMRSPNGDFKRLLCSGAQQDVLQGMSGASNVITKTWRSSPSFTPVYGDCGSPLVVQSPIGTVIVGIHCGYDKPANVAWVAPLYFEDFEQGKRIVTSGALRPSAPIAQVKVVVTDTLRDSDKLFTDYHPNGHVISHGQLRGFRPRAKFSGEKTDHAAYVLSRSAEFTPPIVDNLARPIASSWKQPQMILENYLHPTHSMREDVLRACVHALTKHVSSNLTEEDWADIHPVPISVAVNGFPQVPNVDAQKFTTSAGHGHRGPKLQFLSEPEEFEEWSSYRKYNDVIVEEVNEMREMAYEGIRPHAIFDSSMKDEMLKLAKVLAGKGRSIYMCPVALLTNIRMSVMGLCRVMIRRRDLFGIAVGLNTHSEQWDELHKLSEKIEGNNWVAGDFERFETILSMLLCNGASKFFTALCTGSGNFPEDEIMALKVWLAEISNSTINFFGQLITLMGGEASGHQLTTFFNCVCNQILHIYAYVIIHMEDSKAIVPQYKLEEMAMEFFEKVFRNTLGDDVYLKVSPDRPLYNHTNIQTVFRGMGIGYTMADKTAKSVPYIPLEEVTFLKRCWLDHESFPGMKVAGLDKNSIYKMLMYTIPSKSVSKEEQWAAAICSAVAESFFHGKAFFDQIVDLIDNMPKSDELRSRMLAQPAPTWDEMVQRFISASPKLQARQIVPRLTPETKETTRSYCQFSDLELHMDWSMDAWGSTTMGRSPEERIYAGVRLSSKKSPNRRRVEKDCVCEATLLSKNTNKIQDCVAQDYVEMTHPESKKVINQEHNKKRKLAKKRRWESGVVDSVVYSVMPQSDIQMEGATAAKTLYQQVTDFADEAPDVEMEDMTTRTNALTKDMTIQQDLGQYLSRPVNIRTYTWAELGANGIKDTINPWYQFLNTTDTRSKLRGFSLIRGDLHVKILVNGSPFYYGSMLAAYTPLRGARTDTSDVNAATDIYLVSESQKPHVKIEPQKMSSAEMVLPFLYPYPFLELTTLATIEMGQLRLIQYAPLQSANGITGSGITVTVYAWMENVKLTGPTDLPVMQSDVTVDTEFKPNGQISGPASTLSSILSKLAWVPVIGEYATASSVIAKSIGNIASIFGYTNTPIITDVMPYKQMPFTLASGTISEPITKLTLQPKAEIALGSLQHGGSNKDELVVSHFAGRESYLCNTTWSTTHLPGRPLFTASVSPNMWFNVANTISAQTPLSFAGLNFQYWRGSIKFRFRVIKSAYHKGRFQVGWDRGVISQSQGPAIGSQNALTAIYDLEGDDDKVFIVPYMQPKQFLPLTSTISDTTILNVNQWDTSPTPSGIFPQNGTLSLRVLNSLTAPEASSDVSIQVWVSGGEDIEFAGPGYRFTPVSGRFIGFSNKLTAVAQADVQLDTSASEIKFLPSKVDNKVNLEAFGEKIVSFRELLHRSSFALCWNITDAGTTPGLYRNNIPIKRLPPPPGIYANGWNVATVATVPGQNANFTSMHLLHMMTSCFVGYKGSVNVSVNVEQPTSHVLDTLQVSRQKFGDTLTASERRPQNITLTNTAESRAANCQRYNNNYQNTECGLALTNTKTNTGLSAVLPYYVPSGFLISDLYQEYNNGSTLAANNTDWWEVAWHFPKTASADELDNANTNLYWGSGADFDCVFFLNVPTMYQTSYTVV